MAQYEELKVDHNNNDIQTSLKFADNVIVPVDHTKLNQPSISKSKSLMHSKSKHKHQTETKSQYRSFEPFPERDLQPQRAHTTHCLTKTAPSNLISDYNINTNPDLSHPTSPHLAIANPHLHHDKQHEDASHLAYPINPWDHLMPHKDDIGTPNMAWRGDDGLVHTPHGGTYALTTEAVANFRRKLKYDDSWHRTRQRYICFILLIMFLTVTAVVILLISRKVSIINVEFKDPDHVIWQRDKDCPTTFENVSPGCNVTISPLFNVEINNHNWVPATINTWKVQHTFLCAAQAKIGCPTLGTVIGQSREFEDGVSEINRKHTGVAQLNDSSVFDLKGCHSGPSPNDTWCEWQRSCWNNSYSDPPQYYTLEIEITAQLSFALQAGTYVKSTVSVGMFCNGTGVICSVDNNQVYSEDIEPCQK